MSTCHHLRRPDLKSTEEINPNLNLKMFVTESEDIFEASRDFINVAAKFSDSVPEVWLPNLLITVGEQTSLSTTSLYPVENKRHCDGRYMPNVNWQRDICDRRHGQMLFKSISGSLSWHDIIHNGDKHTHHLW